MADAAFRLSRAPAEAGPTTDYAGAVQVRLAHRQGRSYLIPDLLLIQTGRRWTYFIPSFFGPNWIAFDEGRAVECHVAVDVVRPGTNRGHRLELRIDPTDLRQRHPAGGFLYGCTIRGPKNLQHARGGRAQVAPDGQVLLEMFHFTDLKGQVGIRASGELRSTAWNLAGLQRLENVSYGYCTTLPQVRNRDDLARIAMATDGRLAFRTTSRAGEPEEIFDVEVYRDTTRSRTQRMTFWAPAGALAPPHLLFHRPEAMPAYYELMGPEILRIGVRPGVTIPVSRTGVMTVTPEMQKTFDYVIEGDASTREGVIAPYQEEDTVSVSHLEPLVDDDPFAYWWREQNKALANRPVAEPRRLAPREP